MSEFAAEGFNVLSLSLGISGLQSIALLSSSNVVGWHTVVDLDNGLITARNDNSKTHQNIKIDDLVVPPEYAASLSVALKFFISPEERSATLPESLTAQREDYQYSRKFKLVGITFLVSLFILLVINFFVFQHYQKKNAALRQELVFKSQAYDELQSIEANIAKSQSMISELGIERNTSGTMILDQVAYQMPESILLESIFVRPPENKIKRGKPLSFQTDKIEVSGIANNSEDLNNWLNSIRNMKFIKEVELLNFNRIEEPIGQFEILILLKV
ncbi:PilN domain-containing protein [Halocola ammonii]